MRTQFPWPNLNPGRRILAAAVWLLAAAGTARATVTVEFFFDGGTLVDGSVAVLVADVNGDGFLPFTDPSVTGTMLSKGETVGGSDDKILAVLQAEDGAHWNGSAGIADTMESLDYTEFGIGPGTPLILYVFPYITQPGHVVVAGDDVVTYRDSGPGTSGGDIAFEAPADPGVYTLSALTAARGGGLDLQNPGPGETANQAKSGVAGSANPVDDHRDGAEGSTPATPGRLIPGFLTEGDVDFFSFNITTVSRVIISAIGNTDTTGSLFDSGANLLNDPTADEDGGAGANFRIEEIIMTPGTLNLSVRGRDGLESGAYQLLVEVIPLQTAARPDVTIGKSPLSQKGDDIYNRSGSRQKLKQVSKKRKKLKFYFQVQNDSDLPDTISVIATPKDKYFKAKYFRTSSPPQNVTGLMKRNAYQADLESEAKESFQLLVKPSRRAVRMKKSFTIDVESRGQQDRAKAEVKAK